MLHRLPSSNCRYLSCYLYPIQQQLLPTYEKTPVHIPLNLQLAMDVANSYRLLHTYPLETPQSFAVPSGLMNQRAGYRPTSVVIYTFQGEFVGQLHPGPDAGGYELRKPDVEFLAVYLNLTEGDSLEFEAKSNTDMIVRAYHRDGREKNSGQRKTHKRPHHRVRITEPRQLSHLVMYTFLV